MADRRRFPRLIGPFKGAWRGTSRSNACLIRDISLDGCYVESLTTPQRDEETQITINVNGDDFAAPIGTAVYLESSMSFAVKFRSMTAKERADMSAQMARLLQIRRTSYEEVTWGDAPQPYHKKEPKAKS